MESTSTLAEAEQVSAQVELQVRGNAGFSGIEIAALERDGVYANEACVRVLVNSPDITHDVP